MVDLGAIDEDVPFDAGAADALIAACTSAASAIESQAGSRASYVTMAMKDFRGHFSGLFSDNASTAKGDAIELVSRLKQVATGARRLKEEAAKEQQRRETARRWKREQDHRNLLEKGWDSVFGEDSPPVGPPAAPVSIPVSPSVNTPRRTPAPGSGGGGGGGTSSARPSDLHAFASSSAALNNQLRSKPTSCRSAFAHFEATCHWGSLDVAGVFAGFDKWLAANDNDVRWAKVVGDAFAKAGGEGAVSTLANSAIAATLRAHGVNGTRQDLSIDPPTAYGHPPTTGYAVDPVNTSTGNFVETESDLGFAGACAGLELTRTYNSVDDRVGGFGPGWSSWTEAGLRFDDESASFVMPDGRQVTFPRLGSGWDRGVGENLWLVAEGSAYTVSGSDGSRWIFSREGRLTEKTLGSGTAMRLEWAEGRLVRLTHERGRSIDLVWSDEADLVLGLRASDGREVSYAYDESGRLVAATSPLGTRRYRWNGDGVLAAVVDADGVVEVENVYDEHRRVTRQRTAHGRLVRFVYLPGRVTVVSDDDGARSNTWVADERGRLVGVVDADEQRQSMAYDAHGNLVMVTERDGATTINEHDERGRLVRRVTPSGADLRWTYDEQDRVTGLTVGSPDRGDDEADEARLSFLYDGAERNPSLLVDAEGGRTAMTWQRGLLTRIVDPTGVVVRFGYDAHGDLVATTDAHGNAARLERDDSGRVVAAITPSGHVTRFGYDEQSGLLAWRTDPDGATYRFEHSAAGRLTATVDPLGARTEIEYGADGEEHRTIDPLGRAVTRVFDDLGNLASVELPDGSTWRFAHDALSRLTETIDAAGGSLRQDHDAVGGLKARIAPTGETLSMSTDEARGTATVTEGPAGVPATGTEGPMTAGIRVDRLGRLVASELPDGSSVLTHYDRCGRAVELVDAAGGVTIVRRDAAGRAVAVTRPGGGVVGYEYDACGRPSAVVDELGCRTELRYDADGRVVAQVSPTGEEATWEYDECGRVTRYRIPGAGITTITYDAAGRVVESGDPRFGRRRFVYDAAGQLVQAVNGNGGVTRWEYDANGRAVTITDPEGGVTHREFDAMNHVVAETDPLGRTTRAGYDASGRQVWQESPDGERTEWTYDAAGRVASVAVDGRVVSSISRDVRGRTVQVLDHTQPGAESVHELRWDARGNLLSRTRDGRGLAWEYDADGRRAGRVGPDGDRTSYERDAAGRLVAAQAHGLQQSWTYRDGFVTAHQVTDGSSTAQTLVDRDVVGRVVAVNRDGVHTTYSYDEACQLIEAHTGGDVARWRYDAAGRLVAESHDGTTRELSYDAAGQLLSSREHDGRVLTYSYDGSGRRTRVSAADAGTREFTWSTTGWLSAVVDRDAAGGQRRVTTAVDALGELSRLDSAEVFFDTADRYAPSLARLGDHAVVSTGAFTGIDESWTTPGWRGVRADTADPWGGDFAGVGPAGELGFAGLEWLGARVYDSSARGFLSVDPLEAVPGAGWAGNPYSYAGNDPVHALDPTGLRPATDADLKAFAAAHQGAIHAVDHWLKDNWEYVAGGAMVIAGGVLIATGVGGPLGIALVSAGADTIIQKATTGQVSWGEVVISGAMGAWGAEGAALRLGAKTALQRAVVGGMISGGASGGVGGGYTYMTGPGPHTASGFLTSSATGVGIGTLTGGAGGAASRGLATVGGKLLGHAHPAPSTPFMPQSSGPLSDDLASTFAGGRYVTTVSTDDQVLYRAGTAGSPLGQFFSHEPPQGVLQTRIDKAIPEWWPTGQPAPLDTGYAIHIPAGTTMHTGVVANQGGVYMGGTKQVLIEQPWKIDGVKAVDSWPLH